MLYFREVQANQAAVVRYESVYFDLTGSTFGRGASGSYRHHLT